MVRCGGVLLRKYGNFIDHLRIYVRGGTGGMGLKRLGGEGGKGGDVWVIAKENYTLKKIKDRHPEKRFIAGVGANSSVRALKGEKGKDCEIHAPVGITIMTDEGKEIGCSSLRRKKCSRGRADIIMHSAAHIFKFASWNRNGRFRTCAGCLYGSGSLSSTCCRWDKSGGELNKIGDCLMVARGGRGGSFVTDFLPSKGQVQMIRLDFKLVADIGLVGFPNAGKSSLLSKLSHAKPQIADYAFTTVRPEIGKIMYPDYKQISVADLPGLIEGAHINKGMGHKFLKHVERTKQLLLVVDISGFQLSYETPLRTPFETVQLLTKELELYKKDLLTKRALLAVNKMDLPDAMNKFKELTEQLNQPQDFMHLLPEDTVPCSSIPFKHIIPISTLTGHGIEELKQCLRKSIEEQYEIENEGHQREKLQKLRNSYQSILTAS